MGLQTLPSRFLICKIGTGDLGADAYPWDEGNCLGLAEARLVGLAVEPTGFAPQETSVRLCQGSQHTVGTVIFTF